MVRVSAQRLRLVLLLAAFSLSPTCPPPAFAAPGVAVRLASPARPAAFDRVELAVDVTGGAAWANPFDPDEIAVDAVATGPRGRTLRVPAFWYAPHRRQTNADGGVWMAPLPGAKPGFRVRFAPPLAGAWKVTVTAKDRSTGTGASAPLTLTVAPSNKPGFVRRAPNRRYFAFDDGSAYFLVGENVCWPGRRGLADFDDWFAALGRAGGNFARLWMAFQPIESKESGLGRYDLAHAAHFDAVLEAAERNGLRCMLAFGTYGEFNTGGFFNEGRWPVNPYNAANGGPVPSDKPDEFFTNPEARKLYRRRLRYLVARYAAYGSLAFWEFWNEKGGPTAWFSEMARYVRANDPHRHLITNSYSTTGEAGIWNLPEMDLTQTHRYGDEGSVRDIAPVIADDSRDHDRFNKPHLMGEFGISWRGGDEKFDPNGTGTNLHNGLWASALSGAAGGAAIWWWDGYVHPKNLYGEFAALAAFAKPIPWNKRDFRRVTLPPPTLQTSGPETFSPAVVAASGAWGYVQSGEATLRPDGELSGAGLPGFLYGPAKAEMHRPATLRVRLSKPSALRVKVGGVSDKATLRVSVNGQPVGTFPFDANPAGPRGYESTKQFPEYGGIYQAVFNKEVTVNLPAGESRVTLENAAGDWLTLATLTVENARSSRYAGLRTHALQDASAGETLLWVHDPESNWANDRDGVTPRRFTGVALNVPVPKDGPYRAEWRDTRTGRVVRSDRPTARAKSLTLAVPDFARDIALRLTRP